MRVNLDVGQSYLLEKLERAKGFEPSTPTLARLCSTPELRPLDMADRKSRPGRVERPASKSTFATQPLTTRLAALSAEGHMPELTA